MAMELQFFPLLISLLSHCVVSGVSERLRKPPQKDSDIVTDDYDSNVCLSNFQINDNTIIRTQDSRALGAKYLNETEFTSKEQCLQWCCQTNECNVAVYEEKNKGSCYIFDCGLSRNFKCKFTTHNHYTSAILKVNRHLYDLNKWGSETKHEEELNHLREKNVVQVNNLPMTTAPAPAHRPVTTVATTTISSTTVLPVVSTTIEISSLSSAQGNADKSAGSNSGNQRNTLKTSDINSRVNNGEKWKAMQNQNLNLDNINNGNNGWRQKTSIPGKKPQYHPAQEYPHQPAPHYSQQELQQQLEAQRQGKLHPPQQLSRQQVYQTKSRLDVPPSSGTVFNHKTNGLLQNKDNLDYQQGKNFRHPPIQEQNSYIEPYDDAPKDDFSDSSYNQRLQPPPPPPHYSLQDYDDNNDYWPQEQEKHIGSLPSYEKSKLPANDRSRGHESNMVQPYSHGQSMNHANHDNGMPSHIMQGNYEDQNIYPQRNDYAFSKNLPEKPLPVPKPKMSSVYSPYTNHGHPQNSRVDFPSVKKEHPEQGITESQLPPEAYETNNKLDEQYPNNVENQESSLHPISEEQINKLPKKQTKSEKEDSLIEKSSSAAPVKLVPKNVNSHSQLNKVEVNLAEVEVQKVEHSNESSGAVLALTLGLSVTGILLVLVGCRVRMVRRHLRRGRSPYAHDADYLVNGMYL